MEEKKTGELTDATLGEVSGGAGFVVQGDERWCSCCNRMVSVRIVHENGAIRKECVKCGNPV